jgi:NADH:ubiquinone reductase (H+-translocating)
MSIPVHEGRPAAAPPTSPPPSFIQRADSTSRAPTREGDRTRVVVLGGGFAGVTAARRLERLSSKAVEITLVSRENAFVLTPLLFEACSGRLELRHCAQPIRPALRRTRFVEASVARVDVERRVVHAVSLDGRASELPYDQLIVALGGTTNETIIPGSASALTFKTMADALLVRTKVELG